MSAHLRSFPDPDLPQLLWIRLERPDARNAYSTEMIEQLVAALDRAAEDPDVRCVILTGAGAAFSAGGDLKAMRHRTGMFEGAPVRLREQYLKGIHQIPRRIARFDKPIVAAVNGPAIGAGLDLACMCDVRIAARSAKFGSTFVKVGLIPGDGGAYFLTRTIGFPRALEMILSGRIIGAEEALAMQLVHSVVDDEALEAAARKQAERLARNAPLAVQMAKRLCYRAYEASLDVSLELAASYQGMIQNTRDHEEGVAAILDKRRPEFSGE
ncbi:MAG: enoyl-CoA hydratase-related protein [Myxococcota bacterium]